MDLQSVMKRGVEELRAGHFPDAELLFRSVLTHVPGHADALHLLGCTLSKTGQTNEALDLLHRAITLKPKEAVFYHNLGLALLAAGRRRDAIGAFRQAVQLQPTAITSLVQLGSTLSDMGQHDQAERCFLETLRIRPEIAGVHYNLGNCYFRRATTMRLELNPAQLASARAEQNRLLEKSVEYTQKALSIEPRFGDAGNNLAMALWTMGRREEAIAAWRRTLTAGAHFPAYYNLARALAECEKPDEAIDALQNCIRLDPRQADPFNNLGNCYRARAQIEESLAQFQHAIALQPDHHLAHNNRLYTLYYDPKADSQTILAEHRKWNDLIARPISAHVAPHSNTKDPERRLKIGYISANFWGHCQALFTIPLLSNHDHEHFEIYCYSDVKTPDAATSRLRGYADFWRNTFGVSDEQVAEMIRRDQIDVLVDLTVHMAENRMLVFARKPAPVQVTWLGYPGTTGLETIDYRLTDPYLDPPGQTDRDYSEKSWRLPHTFWCFDCDALQAPQIPEVTNLPAQSAGHITFGCFNNFCKVNQPLLELWKRVLDAVPNSTFLLLAPTGWSRQWVRQTLRDRVDFVSRADRPEYLKYYHRIDIGLDTLPYNGHTTTLDSLWMGVPVISLIGNTVVSRAGLSQFSNLNLREFATRSPEEFISQAVSLAKDIPRLAEIRRTLRDRMRTSPLVDGRQFARDIEPAYRQMWKRYCGVEE